MGLEGAQVELDQLIVLGTLVLPELLGVNAGEFSNVLALCGRQVVVHAVVKGEDRSGSTDFGAHVTDSTHTSRREGVDTRAMVLDNSTSTTLYGENTSNLQDDIYSKD